MRLLHGSASHVGLVRRRNEDSFVAQDGLYAVCDGMGGARAGEVASATACRALLTVSPGAGAREDLARAVQQANQAIRAQSMRDPAMQGMGTTLTAAVAWGHTLTFAHVGDSRAYLLRAGRLEQLTQDHSLVAEMVRRGQLTPAQAAVHPHRSIIIRALGPDDTVEPDLFTLELQVGDRVLFCSDGLSGMVREEEIERLLAGGDDPQAVADALVRAALAGGGEDNVTAVVVIVAGDPVGDEVQDDPATGEPATGDPAATDPAASDPAGGDRTAVAPAASGRRRRLALALVGLLLVLVVGLGGLAVFNSTVYFVGTSDGSVALFRGMPYRVLGVTLYEPVEVSPVRYDVLDEYLRIRVDSHELITKEEGLRFIRGLAAGR